MLRIVELRRHEIWIYIRSYREIRLRLRFWVLVEDEEFGEHGSAHGPRSEARDHE